MKLESIRKTCLDNGLRLITEHIPSVRSVSIGFWIIGGSRIEKPEQNGITHFIEHMLFKGTPTRKAYDIAREIDSLGGQLDAFTSREYSCLLATILDDHLPQAIDILTDLLKNSLFHEQEIDRERKVILEEIKMIEDTPDEYVHDLCIQNFWPHQALGRSVIGYRKNIQSFIRDNLVDYFHQNFLPSQIVIAAAGNIKHEYFQNLIQQKNLFPTLPNNKNLYAFEPSTAHKQIAYFPKKLEQIHICLMMEGISQNHRLRFAGYILNSILGGGMSSRLFQKIREQQGLAYSVFSSWHSYQNTGLVSIYAATCPDSFFNTVQLILEELKILKKQKVSEEELQRTKNQLKGALMLGLESTANRMSKLARQEIYFGQTFSLAKILSQIEEVTTEDILELANLLFDTEKLSLTVLGDVKEPKMSLETLWC